MSVLQTDPNVFLRHSVGYVVATVIPALIAFPVLVLYTWLLSPSAYGVYVAVATAVAFVHAATFEWLRISALRLSHGRGSEAFLAAALVCFAGVVGVGAVIAIAIAALFKVEANVAILGFGMFVAISWTDLNLALLRAGLEVRQFAKLAVMRSAATHGVSLALVLAGFGIEGLLIGAMIGPLVPGLWIARSTWGRVRPSDLHKVEVRKILVFGLPLIAGQSAGQLAASIDRLALTLLRPSAGLGVYAAAFGVAQRMFASIIEPIGGAGFSLAVRAHKEGDEAGASERLSINLLIILAIGVPSAVGLGLVARDLADAVFGPEFREEAAMLLPIMGVTCLLLNMRTFFTEQAFHLAQRTAAYSKVVAVMAVVAVPVHVVLIQNYGPLGAAWAMLASQSFGFALSFVVAQRLFPLRVPLGDAARVLVATAAMSATVYAIPAEGTVKSLLVRVAAGIVVYAIAVLALNITGVRPLVSTIYHKATSLIRRDTATRADAEPGE